MAQGRFIAYYRVSTAKQGRSGLGLEAQQVAVRQYLNGGTWTLLYEFTEQESGRKADRPQLQAALNHCRLTGATLVIAKLDRLARNVAFLANLMDGGVDFVAVDNPHATRFNLHILSAVAEFEAKMISERTKVALAASSARRRAAGQPPLGGYRGGPVPNARLAGEAVHERANAFAARLIPLLDDMQIRGLSLQAMAAELTAKGIRTPRAGAWTATAVRRALARINP